MTDDAPLAPVDAREPGPMTFAADVVEAEATIEIDNAVTGRRGVARKYVLRLRRRHPDATPAEVIRMLEHHYTTAISAAGAAITVGAVVVEIGISLIPGGGAVASGGKAAAKSAGKVAAKKTAKETIKRAGKEAALGVAKTGAQRAPRCFRQGTPSCNSRSPRCSHWPSPTSTASN